jgi:sugar/nucleoside kinase (ribokinase family)
MESGSLKVGASDFRIIEQSLTLEFVKAQIGAPGKDDFLVLDANISAHLMDALVRAYGAATRVIFEPVSVEKTMRHMQALADLFLMTPTEEELLALEAKDIHSFMAERRIENLVVTRGSAGARLYRGATEEDFPPGAVIEAGDTSGAGDLLLASLLSRLHEGLEIPIALRAAMSAVEEKLRKGML